MTLLRPASLAILAWATLAGNMLVMLQGALVRATGSGAGCGSHWPSCQGEVIPLAAGTETLLEFGHRLLSLVVFVLGAVLLIRAWRHRRARPSLFAFAGAAFVFLLLEVLLGAATVLLGLTGDNATVGRGIMVASHLVNSMLLVGTLAGAVVFARERSPAWPLRIGHQRLPALILGGGLFGMLVLMFSGGVAAMGDTMFPAESLGQGLAADFDLASHPLIRLRVLHPLIAVLVGTYLFFSLGLGLRLGLVVEARRLALMLLGVYSLQLAIGTVNLAFLAPVPLQLLHLALAILSFGLLAAVTVTALGFPTTRAERGRGAGGARALGEGT